MSVVKIIRSISIHAPRGGSDVIGCGRCFYSIISIHAPRGGSDPQAAAPRAPEREKFQSTLPAGGATREYFRALDPRLISIHAPRGGSDEKKSQNSCFFEISIHAPRGGSDIKIIVSEHHSFYFNPRSPRGERLLLPFAVPTNYYFNPRSPRGERLRSDEQSWWGRYFNPRSPRGERRLCVEQDDVAMRDFNPRSPRGERHPVAYDFKQVSIQFQSTLPAGGATCASGSFLGFSPISIHAPRGGSDSHFSTSMIASLRISIHAPRGGSDYEVLWMVARAHPHVVIIYQSGMSF